MTGIVGPDVYIRVWCAKDNRTAKNVRPENSLRVLLREKNRSLPDIGGGNVLRHGIARRRERKNVRSIVDADGRNGGLYSGEQTEIDGGDAGDRTAYRAAVHTAVGLDLDVVR